MRLFVRHRSEYRFSEPQTRLVQLLRLTPADHGGQSIVSWHIAADRDARLRRARDGHANATTMLYVDGPLERAVIEVTGEVLTEDRAGLVAGAAEPLPPIYFLQPTPLTHADERVVALAAELDAAADALTRAHGLMDILHDRLAPLEADAGSDQSASARLAAGAADPQGAAHLMIAAARAGGFPARYVAGHLYRDESPEMHAAHGWAELFVDGYGWIGFDPFEGRCPTDRYVRVAIGLDHSQAAPISGLRTGGGREALAVDVRVGPRPAPQD